jgi:hypothetical protein
MGRSLETIAQDIDRIPDKRLDAIKKIPIVAVALSLKLSSSPSPEPHSRRSTSPWGKRTNWARYAKIPRKKFGQTIRKATLLKLASPNFRPA